SELVRSLSDRIASRYRNTFYAFNEYNEPTIEDEFAKILAGGFSKIVVVPVFMASGAHLGEEIPNKLAIPPGSGGSVIDHEGHPVRICYQEPFGMDPRLNDILAAKISGPAN
ncbi:MAG: sirohydrochlorin cobaltochelatase, partial [Candidatus Methanoplasma sp.]|nr:sirohydrochlorin cobaltochelatase [Candidatus Methanoplasma sp.]